jgi:hypothetical protein
MTVCWCSKFDSTASPHTLSGSFLSTSRVHASFLTWDGFDPDRRLCLLLLIGVVSVGSVLESYEQTCESRSKNSLEYLHTGRRQKHVEFHKISSNRKTKTDPTHPPLFKDNATMDPSDQDEHCGKNVTTTTVEMEPTALFGVFLSTCVSTAGGSIILSVSEAESATATTTVDADVDADEIKIDETETETDFAIERWYQYRCR